MDDKITIIEGPPPTFEEVDDGWAVGLSEGPLFYDVAVTRLRTFNGDALVERCHRAWSKHGSMVLHYRNDIGLEEQSAIVAVRSLKTSEGDVLLLWVRRDPDEPEFDDVEGDDDMGEIDEE